MKRYKVHYILSVLCLMAWGSLGAQTVNGADAGSTPSFVNPDSRHQVLNPKMRVLRSDYKGPKSAVPNVHQKKNRAYSLIPTPAPKSGPISLIHPLTPIPTVAPFVPRDAKGNPIKIWSPGQKINLPSTTGSNH